MFNKAPVALASEQEQNSEQMSELKQEAYAAWWQATSKVRIGDCPARNTVPPNCKPITPKPITDFDYVKINQDYAD